MQARQGDLGEPGEPGQEPRHGPHNQTFVPPPPDIIYEGSNIFVSSVTYPMNRSVRRSIRRLVGWLVCHNFLKGRAVSLPCSQRRTRSVKDLRD